MSNPLKSNFGCIYHLKDPRSGKTRYVGKTRHKPEYRLKQHIRDSLKKHNYTAHWIRQLKSKELLPIVEVMSIHHHSELSKEEIKEIARLRKAGFNLTNATPGGDGGGIKGRIVSEATKQKLSEAAKRQWADPDIRTRMTESLLAVTSRPEFGAAVTAGALGKPKLSMRGRKFSVDRKAAMAMRFDSRPFQDGNGVIYRSSVDAAEKLGIASRDVRRILTGKRLQCHGHVFRYLDEVNRE